MPLIKARSSSIMESVDLRGQPTAPTAQQSVNTNQLASTAFVRTAIAELIDSSPALLDTLSELAAAINNDEAFSVTVANSIATKLPKDGSEAMTGELILSGDPTQNLGAVTKQYVDNAIDGQMIYSTDDVAEGTTNLYYTDGRVRSAVSLDSDNTVVLDYDSSTGQFTYRHPTSDGVLEGQTNQYFTVSRARNSISMNSDDGTIISYSAITGEITFTTPDTDKIVEGSTNLYFTTARARNSVSNGANIDYDSATGVISTQAAVWSVNGQTHDVVLDTDDVTEGSSNLYFSQARARGSVSLTTDNSNILSYSNATGVFTWVTPSTDAISEGSTNLYFTNARARSAVSLSSSDTAVLDYDSSSGVITFNKPTTDGITEGSNNLYYTDARARNSVSLSTDNASVFTYDNTTGLFTFTLGNQTTDDVQEGSNNLYYTDARARASIDVDGWANLSYNSSTGTISISAPSTDDVSEGNNLYFTTARARNSVSATDAGGDGSFSYDSTSGTFTYTGPSASETRAHLSASHTNTGNAYGLGDDFTYDASTGVFTYQSPLISEIRTVVSATTASGVTYDNQTGVIALSSIPNSSLANSDITINGATISLGGSDTLDTDDIGEGATNLYYTQARFDSAFAAKDTGDLAEGSNLYYTQARFDSAFAAKDTDGLAEGSNNLYYTTARTRADVSGGTGVTYTQATGVFEIGQPVATTDNVTFNDVTVSGDLTVNGTMTAVNSTTVTIADKNLTLASGSANATQANGAGITVDGANATITYASGTDSWNLNKDVSITGGLTLTEDLTAPTFTGDLTGDVTGNVTGDVTGNLTGNVTGDVTSTGTSTFSTVDINGGNIDGTVIGGATPAAVTGTTVTATTGFTGDLTGNVTGNVTGDLTGNVTGNLTGDVTGTVSDISNHDTDALAEGSTNLYFTDARARNAVSATDAGGDGSFSYDSATGVFTYTGPSDSEVRAHFSATSNTGITYDNSTGVFALASIPNASLTNSNVTVNGYSISLGGSQTLDTDDIGEGSTNQYYLDSRARNAVSLTSTNTAVLDYDSATGVFTFDLAGTTTDEVTEGSTNLYFTNARARSAISMSSTWSNVSYDSTSGVITVSAPDTDDVTEGSTNLYFTNARARTAVSLVTDNNDALSYDNTTGQFTFALSSVDTDEIAEGSLNLYFTTARARNSISNGANIDYDATTGIISTQAAVWSVNGQTHDVVLDTDNIDEGSANLYFTDARARSAITLTTDDSNILSYNSGTGALVWVTPTTDSIDEGANNLYYTDGRADARIAAASIRDLSDVNKTEALQDGYTLVWSSALGEFVPQNVAVTATTLNFTGDGTTTSFSTGVEVSSIDNTQVFINGLVQAPTYSYTISTVSNVTSIVFDTAPELNDYIFVRVTATSSLTAGGVLNEASTIDGGSY